MLSSGAEPKQEGKFLIDRGWYLDTLGNISSDAFPENVLLGDIIFAEVPTEKFCIAASSTCTYNKQNFRINTSAQI